MASTENVSIDKLYSKEETTNYCRIILLMVGVGTETLLRLFYSLVPKDTVKGYFASKKSEIEDGKREVFDKSQYAKLTCPDPNPDEFDISLLIKLLTYFKLSPVKLDCLQRIRNEIVGHKSRAELTKQYFESLWAQVKDILLNIAKCVSGDDEKETKLKVEDLKQKVLDVSDREKIKAFETCYKEEISALHEKSDRNKENIENLRVDVIEIQKDVCRLHDAVSESQHATNKQYAYNDKSLCGTDDKSVLMLRQDLINYYRKKLCKLQLSPLFEEEGYAADFFDFYVKPNITNLSHQRSKGQSESTHVAFHDIFNCKPCQNIYISSPAGCGKTSFAKYLALIWCQAHLPVESYNQWILKEDINEMRTFMFLFIIFLRDERECDVDIMIENQLLLNLANSTIYTELGMKFLQNLLTNEKCIIILDGLDEWSHPAGDICKMKNKHIPHSRVRPQCTTLTTSRPWKLDAVRLKPEDIDQNLELNGLEGDLLERLVDKVVTRMNKLHGKDIKADDFKQELRDKKLIALSKIPVVVMHLLTVWFDNETLGHSQCEIYSNMIKFLLKRYCKKREIEDKQVADCSRDRQTPKCSQNIYCKVHMELLSKLVALAYNTLFTDNEESSLIFDKSIAKKYLTDQEIEISLAVGILTQEKVIGKSSIRKSHISFIHKTFQEYLAALYVALSPGMVTHIEEKIKRVCCSIEQIMEMSQIFMFMSGLCPNVMANLHEHLRRTVSEDNRTQRYRASCEPEMGPRWSSEGWTLMQVQDIMMECLGECWLNGHKHVSPLPVSDFFIEYPSPWSDELKSLAVQNPVCSLCVIGVNFSPEKIEDILNSVTVFNSIQKLWLGSVSDTFVVQLVSRHKHSWSVRPEAWKNLGWVTLQMVEMSGDILCSLVDSILQLPKSAQVRLVGCSISQGTQDWKEYIRSHPRLSVDDDRVVARTWNATFVTISHQ